MKVEFNKEKILRTWKIRKKKLNKLKEKLCGKPPQQIMDATHYQNEKTS